MDSIKKFFEDIFSTVKDRMSHPFMGAFVIAFLIYNWELFYYILSVPVASSADYSANVKYVYDNYYKCSTVLCPLFFTFLYLYVYPFVLDSIEYINNWLKTFREKVFTYKHKDYTNLLDSHNQQKVLLRSLQSAKEKDLRNTVKYFSQFVKTLVESHNYKVDSDIFRNVTSNLFELFQDRFVAGYLMYAINPLDTNNIKALIAFYETDTDSASKFKLNSVIRDMLYNYKVLEKVGEKIVLTESGKKCVKLFFFVNNNNNITFKDLEYHVQIP